MWRTCVCLFMGVYVDVLVYMWFCVCVSPCKCLCVGRCDCVWCVGVYGSRKGKQTTSSFIWFSQTRSVITRLMLRIIQQRRFIWIWSQSQLEPIQATWYIFTKLMSIIILSRFKHFQLFLVTDLYYSGDGTLCFLPTAASLVWSNLNKGLEWRL